MYLAYSFFLIISHYLPLGCNVSRHDSLVLILCNYIMYMYTDAVSTHYILILLIIFEFSILRHVGNLVDVIQPLLFKMASCVDTNICLKMV